MKGFCIPATLLVLAVTANAIPRITVEVVSVSQTFHFVVGQPTTTIYDANVILPDGSHINIQCLQDAPGCGIIDNGSGKVQAKRHGKSLEIYTATGKRRYEIVGSW